MITVRPAEMPPLGYDVKDRKLVVNEEEARTVRHILQRYLALKSVRALKDELAGAQIKSKRRVRPDGTAYSGPGVRCECLFRTQTISGLLIQAC